MNLSIVYCEQCFRNLKEWGELAELIYEHVCEFYVLNQMPLLVPDNFSYFLHGFSETIKFLESKKYIVTTEFSKDKIRIRPTGIFIDDHDGVLDWHFCAQSCCS